MKYSFIYLYLGYTRMPLVILIMIFVDLFGYILVFSCKTCMGLKVCLSKMNSIVILDSNVFL